MKINRKFFALEKKAMFAKKGLDTVTGERERCGMPVIRRWGLFLGMSIILALLPACGYSTRNSLPSEFKAIDVEPFVNKIDFQSRKAAIYVPLMEVKAHDALVSQFQFDGSLRIAKQEDADLILKGELINYDRSAVRLADNNDVQEYRIQITVHLTMSDRAGKILWEESSFSGEASYFLSGSNATPESSAVENAIKDLAKRIVERTVEDW